MRGRVVHPPPCTAGAKAATFAREGDEQILIASVASASHESVCKHAAAQIIPHLLLDVMWKRLLVRVARPANETLALLSDDAVERRLGRPPRSIRSFERSHVGAESERRAVPWGLKYRRVVRARVAPTGGPLSWNTVNGALGTPGLSPLHVRPQNPHRAR